MRRRLVVSNFARRIDCRVEGAVQASSFASWYRERVSFTPILSSSFSVNLTQVTRHTPFFFSCFFFSFFIHEQVTSLLLSHSLYSHSLYLKRNVLSVFFLSSIVAPFTAMKNLQTHSTRHLPLLLLLLLSLVTCTVNSLPSVLKVGALFPPDQVDQRAVFNYAVNRINSDTNLLLQSVLSPQIETVARNDSFRAVKSVCSLLSKGVAAIFGPLAQLPSIHVGSVCDALEIPHIEAHPDIHLDHDNLSINLYPRDRILVRALAELISEWNWKSFAILYEDNDGAIRLNDFLKEAYIAGWKVTLYQFTPGVPYRETFWKVKYNVKNILLDVKIVNVQEILRHAQQVGMMTESYSFLITTLDLHTIDLEDFKWSKTKITSLRLLDTTSSDYLDWSKASIESPDNIPDPMSVTTETALLFDSVKLLALGLQELDQSQAIDTITPLNCENEIPWTHGSSLLNYIRPISFKGATGLVSFDQKGFRSGSVLSVMTIQEDGLSKVATWSEEKGLTRDDNFARHYSSLSMKNLQLVITTVLNEPYTMLRDSAERKEGNDRFEGYGIDLIEELSKILQFKYTFQLVKDKAYGVKNNNGEWNGMIGEIMRGEADLAVADLTITSKREEAVDFTLPFMNTGISILFKKPTAKVTSLFSFLSPFSMVVWIYVVGAYIAVSVILFLVGRLSPYEWDNPHPCRKDERVLENDFSLLNSFWFTIGSLMQQGSNLQPKSLSTRAIAGIWYFFTLITISSYTANLAAFLTVEKVVYPIESAEDLSLQSEIKYGCVATGSTRSFFQESTIPTYQRMWKFMQSREDNFVSSNADGRERVSRENYAFLMESASIEYIIERNCNLTQIGGLLDSKGYGIATRKDSPYRSLLSQAILQLQESGVLHTLKDRWWKQKRGGGACVDDKKGSAVNELSLANVGGVFVGLLGGLVFSIIVAWAEFVWKALHTASDNDSLWSKMLNDIKFALSCSSSTKEVRKRSSLSLSNSISQVDRLMVYPGNRINSIESNVTPPLLADSRLPLVTASGGSHPSGQPSSYHHHQLVSSHSIGPPCDVCYAESSIVNGHSSHVNTSIIASTLAMPVGSGPGGVPLAPPPPPNITTSKLISNLPPPPHPPPNPPSRLNTIDLDVDSSTMSSSIRGNSPPPFGDINSATLFHHSQIQ